MSKLSLTGCSIWMKRRKESKKDKVILIKKERKDIFLNRVVSVKCEEIWSNNI